MIQAKLLVVEQAEIADFLALLPFFESVHALAQHLEEGGMLGGEQAYACACARAHVRARARARALGAYIICTHARDVHVRSLGSRHSIQITIAS